MAVVCCGVGMGMMRAVGVGVGEGGHRRVRTIDGSLKTFQLLIKV
jgi:hypothetical protein